MRSGPCAQAILNDKARQRNTRGGPSGTSAMASISSACSSNIAGRRAAMWAGKAVFSSPLPLPKTKMGGEEEGEGKGVGGWADFSASAKFRGIAQATSPPTPTPPHEGEGLLSEADTPTRSTARSGTQEATAARRVTRPAPKRADIRSAKRCKASALARAAAATGSRSVTTSANTSTTGAPISITSMPKPRSRPSPFAMTSMRSRNTRVHNTASR